MKLTPLQPFGVIAAAEDHERTLLDVSPGAIVELLDRHLLAVFRGFSLFEDDTDYTAFARQFGPLLAWEFGEVLELKVRPDPPNHIFRSGRVELHWDGAFIEQKPRYNVFQCIRGSQPDGGGETLFVNALAVWQRATESEQQSWKDITIEYVTEKKAHYGGAIRRDLVQTNPYRNTPVIRYIEADNEDNRDINPMTVHVEGCTPEASARFLHDFTRRLYRDDVMYRHRWRGGDFLIADNASLLHGRSRFTGADVGRHIKRINIL